MDAPDWVSELAALAELFRETGAICDLANMSMADRYGGKLGPRVTAWKVEDIVALANSLGTAT